VPKVNDISPICSLSNQDVTYLSAFDLEPDALIGLNILWNSSFSWKDKASMLHGAWLILPTTCPLSQEVHFLNDLCWTRHRMEFAARLEQLA
jgi:hypothetical protein